MTLAAEPWPSFTDPPAGGPAGGSGPSESGVSPGGTVSPRVGSSGSGTLVVWRLELAKLSSLLRVRALVFLCLIAAFLAVVGLNLQTATPGDTQFGQWVHVSGFAIPMVVLGFGGQWLLPVLTGVVAGDIFSAEDHFGTWKTILTRSRTRGQLFAGKFLAAVTFAVAAMVLLTASDLVAGLLAGTQPVVGLGGQLVPAPHATELVIASWLSEIPPVLGFTAVAALLSVVSRNSLVGVGGTALITLLLQIVTLINLPEWGQLALLSTPFLAWHGFWTQPAFYGPFWYGLATCAGWFAVCGAASWLVFRHRTIGGAS